MALNKVVYTDGLTVIGADNLNAIQDEVIANASSIASKVGQTELQNALSVKASISSVENVNRRVDALFDLSEGQLFDFDVDTATCYSATVPSGAIADSVTMIGGNSVVVDGSIVHAGCKQVETVGVGNLWDEVWELGGFSTTTGEKDTTTNKIRSKNRISVLPSTTYSVVRKTSASYTGAIYGFYYDINGSFIRYALLNSSTQYSNFTTGDTTYYVSFQVNSYGTTYNNDISIQKGSYSGKSYHPYVKHTYQIPQAIQSLTGYGQSNGSTYNYVDYANKKYHYFGQYVNGSWVASTETITDISSLIETGFLEALSVESGGTITFVHDTDDNYRLPVPNTNEFIIKLNEV